MTDFSDEDITVMRQQGDLRGFFRQQIAEGAARRDSKPKPPAPPRPPGHTPGAWPPGTSPAHGHQAHARASAATARRRLAGRARQVPRLARRH